MKRWLIYSSLPTVSYIVLTSKTESLKSIIAVHPFEIMSPSYITTSFSGFLPTPHPPAKENLQSICKKKSNRDSEKVHKLTSIVSRLPRATFSFSVLNVSPFFSYVFSSSHFNGLFHHSLKYTTLEDTTVCSASSIFITFYYKLGLREVLHLIWRTCPVSFIFLQDFYQANLIQL